MLYIENLCEFVRLLVESGDGGTFCPQNAEYTNTSEMVKLIAEAHGKKIRLIKGFGWLIKFFGIFSSTIQKAFGSLIYDKTNRNIIPCSMINFTESIKQTEMV